MYLALKTYELLELLFSFKSSPRCTRSAPKKTRLRLKTLRISYLYRYMRRTHQSHSYIGTVRRPSLLFAVTRCVFYQGPSTTYEKAIMRKIMRLACMQRK
jgi:hypothetical protein